jgi:protein disulfide-isomerase
MKILNILFLVCIAAFHACSQPSSTQNQQSTSQTPAAKPATPAYTATKEGWIVDLDEAYARSTKEGKPILANFTGSDWCGWCKKLDADVFSKPEFKSWAAENVILLELDFPRRKQLPQKNQSQNMSMKNALGISGFPTIWVFNMTKDANGQYQVNKLAKSGYKPSVAEFIASVDHAVK